VWVHQRGTAGDLKAAALGFYRTNRGLVVGDGEGKLGNSGVGEFSLSI
jgi:hypothetical protein